MRLTLSILGLILFASTTSARADVIYNLALTSTAGFQGGYGSFALNVAPPPTGTVNYVLSSYTGPINPGTPGYLVTAATISMYSTSTYYNATQLITYGLYNFATGTDFGPDPFVTFTDGTITAMQFYTTASMDRSYSLGVGPTGYGYRFSFYSGGARPFDGSDQGTVAVKPAASAVPEPSSLLLLGTGMLAFTQTFRKRCL